MKNNVSYIFFNCDEWKSTQSMNIKYNDSVYRKRAGLRALWRKVKNELDNGNITIESNDIAKVRQYILSGEPWKANDFIVYGYIGVLNEES